MKFALAYYLLLIYTTVIAKPLIPVAEDSLEHCFAEAYHIATVHAVYGNNHLEAKVAAASDSNDNNSSKSAMKDETATAHIAAKEAAGLLHLFSCCKIYFNPPTNSVFKIFQSIIIPPPKL